MLQKFLLIGLGGSGGKTLRYTWRALEKRLDAAGWEHGVPDGWQFLHIDVPQYSDVIEGDVPADVGKALRYLGLARQPNQYRDYDDQLLTRQEALSAVAGWRPDPKQDYSNIYKGAGQRRVVGRVVTLAQLLRVGEAIDHAVSRLAKPEVEDQMRKLDECLGTRSSDRDADPATAVVISSLGGGAGSGALQDVIELLRTRATQQAQWLDNSLLTVLFAADVFAGLPADQRDGVEPNSLAALAELLNAGEHEGPIPQVEGRLLDPGGGTVPVSGRRIGRHNFIIGTRNEAVHFDVSLDVFRAAGKGLATFIMDDAVRQPFQGYLAANADGRPVTERFPFSSGGRCSSFGYANVSLGRDLFAKYATERLAKRCLERLLRGHRENVPDAHLRREQTLISDRVELARPGFFEASGLWELGHEHNQVLDKLRDRNELGKQLEGVVRLVASKLHGLGKRSPLHWFESLTANFNDQASAFESSARQQISRNAQLWVSEIQVQVVEATARHAGRYGLPVAIGLLDALNQQAQDAASELRRDAAALNKEEADLLTKTRNLFVAMREKILTSVHESLNLALKDRRTALQRRVESHVCGVAAELLDEVSSGLLPQLRSALGAAEGALIEAEEREHRAVVSQWSMGSLPPHLRPAPNELLIDQAESFPGQLEKLFDAQVEGKGSDAGETEAIEEIISRSWLSEQHSGMGVSKQDLITCAAAWMPTLSSARLASTGARHATFRIELTPLTILNDARAWVRKRPGPISGYASETLADWLDVEHKEVSARGARFAALFDQAVTYAAPLVSVNSTVHRVVHGDDPPPPALSLSQIPLDRGHPACARVETSLVAAGLTEGTIAGLLNPTSQNSEVEITSFVGRYVHPIVFDSLTTPIQRDWQSRLDQPQREKFWQFRRSRTLTAFVPVGPRRQEALVRGWLTASVLGYVGVLQGRWSEKPLTVWTPRGEREFPQHLLGGDIARHGSVLPALLMSLPLALMTFASGEGEELEAYMRLLELGTPAGGLTAAADEANQEFYTWIRYGILPTAQEGFDPPPVPRAATAGTAEGELEERAEAILVGLQTYAMSYSTAFVGQKVTRESALTLGPGWEIRDLVARATTSLIASVRRISGGDDPDLYDALAVPER